MDITGENAMFVTGKGIVCVKGESIDDKIIARHMEDGKWVDRVR